MIVIHSSEVEQYSLPWTEEEWLHCDMALTSYRNTIMKDCEPPPRFLGCGYPCCITAHLCPGVLREVELSELRDWGYIYPTYLVAAQQSL